MQRFEAAIAGYMKVSAVPTFCDIGENWKITPESVAPKITDRMKALIVVHAFGICLDARPFREFQVPIDAIEHDYRWWNWGETWESQHGIYRFKKR